MSELLCVLFPMGIEKASPACEQLVGWGEINYPHGVTLTVSWEAGGALSYPTACAQKLEHPSPLPYVASDRDLAHASRWW